MTVSLRPHHVLCSIGYEGHGYDDPFTANMTRIVARGFRGPEGRNVAIRITFGADTLCAPCPKRVNLGCQTQSKIDRLDAAHAEILGLRDGQTLTWGAALDRVRDRVGPEDLDRICEGCGWLDAGMCKRALAALRAEPARLAIGED
jgi:hypothetical protein